MGIRKEFMLHKGRTVESFEMVRADISSILTHIGGMRDMISSLDSRISVLDIMAAGMKGQVEKCLADFGTQQSRILSTQSKIERIGNLTENLLVNIRKQGLKNRQINSSLAKCQKDIEKIKKRLKSGKKSVRK